MILSVNYGAFEVVLLIQKKSVTSILRLSVWDLLLSSGHLKVTIVLTKMYWYILCFAIIFYVNATLNDLNSYLFKQNKLL